MSRRLPETGQVGNKSRRCSARPPFLSPTSPRPSLSPSFSSASQYPMLRRMTDKLLAHPGNRDHGSPSPTSTHNNIPSSSSLYKHNPNHPLAPTSGHPQAPEYPLHRGSISTERTSESGDRSYLARPSVERHSSLSTPMDEDEELPLPPQPRRVMGSYKLADFFFHRTLGTGSFGRVHLGAFICLFVGCFYCFRM